MKNDLKQITLLLTIFVCFTNAQNFEDYDYGKIHLKKGFIIEGENLEFSDNNNLSINVSGSTQFFSLDEVKTIYSGKKQIFSPLGAVIGTTVIIVPMLLIGDDFYEFFGATLSISIGGGTIIGFLTPSLIGNKIKWTLLYSV